MRQHRPAWEGPILADVAVFVINHDVNRGVGSLAVAMARDAEGTLSLPSTQLEGRAALEDAAREAVRGLIPGTPGNTWPSPLIWQTETMRISDNTARLGYAAAARLVDMPEDGSLVLINPDELAKNRAIPVTDSDRKIIALGLQSLRRRVDKNEHATTEARQNTLPILARLLDNPAAFTLAELREVFSAILGTSLDKGNFANDAPANKWMGLIATTAQTTETGGRPAKLWGLPHHILQTLGERPSGR